jgi:glucosyl-dolichyl phosphate glucuronosyltransferase
MAIDVSVIVCTLNRSAMLKRCLSALTKQSLSPGVDLEVIIVDNGSKDDTRNVANQFMNGPLDVTLVHEKRLGISFARNRGIEIAKGALICFIDDDIFVQRDHVANWIRAWRAGIWDLAGGRVCPYGQTILPSWVRLLPKQALNGPLGLHDRGENDFLLGTKDDRMPITSNIAIRRHVFEKIGLFDTTLGSIGHNLGRGEDTEFCQRASNAGMRIGYLGSCSVMHFVPMWRLTRGYFLKWKYTASITGSHEILSPSTVFWFGVPRYTWRELLETTLNLFLSIFGKSAFYHLFRTAGVLGSVVGHIAGRRRMSV